MFSEGNSRVKSRKELNPAGMFVQHNYIALINGITFKNHHNFYRCSLPRKDGFESCMRANEVHTVTNF